MYFCSIHKVSNHKVSARSMATLFLYIFKTPICGLDKSPTMDWLTDELMAGACMEEVGQWGYACKEQALSLNLPLYFCSLATPGQATLTDHIHATVLRLLTAQTCSGPQTTLKPIKLRVKACLPSVKLVFLSILSQWRQSFLHCQGCVYGSSRAMKPSGGLHRAW